MLGDIDNLVNLFCNRFDMAVQRATQRTSGLLVSMLDVVDPLQAAKGLTFGHPIFTVLCLDKSSVYFCFPLSTWMSISIHIRLFTAATDLLPIRGPGNHGYSDYSFFLLYFMFKIHQTLKMNVLFNTTKNWVIIVNRKMYPNQGYFHLCDSEHG